MVGVDGSRAMLSYAKVNAPGVPVVQADARMCGFRQHFDAIVCAFDSLNHMLSADVLAMAFRSAYACLRPGGSLLFDVNTELSYTLHWNGEDEMATDDCRIHTWSHYDADKRLGTFRVTTEWLETAAPTTEAILWQRCHSHEEIIEALTRTGFRGIETFWIDDGALVSGSLEGAERVFYLCHRPTPGRRR
jgi:SAM-dependent methyltransferase